MYDYSNVFMEKMGQISFKKQYPVNSIILLTFHVIIRRTYNYETVLLKYCIFIATEVLKGFQ